jgi:DNA mismatch repair protein MutS2
MLMVKAGLFVPAVGQPQLPWFDRILADIGDDQVMLVTLASISGCFSKI